MFKQYKTPEELLDYLKNRNVQVIETQKNPWAQKLLKQIGSGAVILYPDRGLLNNRAFEAESPTKRAS